MMEINHSLAKEKINDFIQFVKTQANQAEIQIGEENPHRQINS